MADGEETVELGADAEQTAEETAPSPVEKPDGEAAGEAEEAKGEPVEEGGATEAAEKSAEGEQDGTSATPPSSSSTQDDSKLKELTDDQGTNAKNLACERCQSVVLRPGLAKVTQKEYFLPHMKVKSASQEPGDGETLRDFWLVEGMYTFENVGFTNTVQDIKYLICADCEVGPIGCHDLKVKNHFFVGVDRVTYT